MKKYLIKLFLTSLVIFFGITAFSQKPFQQDIDKFKQQDEQHFPEKEQVLFIGSSSFTLWKDVQESFPKSNIINRGFGGSSLPHLIDYADDIIFPYHPNQIVIYCGENDIAGGANAEQTFERFKNLYALIRDKMPYVPILYVSIKPSPSRMKYLNEMVKANNLISDFIKKENNIKFINVFSKMLKRNYPVSEIFTSDSLHMNANGYKIWTKKIQPHLLKN